MSRSGSDRDPDEGQVSEASALGDPEEPIAPEDATAAYPGGESGEADEGPAGPDATVGDHPR